MGTTTAFLLVVGSITLFMVGFAQITGILGRRFTTPFREAVAGTSSGKAHSFAAGFQLAALGGSDTSGIVTLIAIADGRAREVENSSWIFLGINLGGTVVCWILAFLGFRIALTPAALIALAATLPLRSSSSFRRQAAADALTGIALLMLGIDLTTGLVPILPDPTAISSVVERLFSRGFVVGLVVSIVLRSSTGTVFFAMAMFFRGWIPFDTAAAMVLAGNIGPAVTAWWRVRGFTTAARRTAFTGILVSVFAILSGAVLFAPLTRAATQLVPGVWGLALFHTVVHGLNIPLTVILHRLLRILAVRLVPDTRSAGAGGSRDDESSSVPGVNLLPAGFPESLDANLGLTQSALAAMADRAYEMLMIVINVSQVEDGVAEATERAIALRGVIKDLEEQVSVPLTRSVQLPCTRLQAERIQQQQRISQELSLIADDCYKTIRLLERSYRKNYRFHRESRDELFDFTSQILDFLRYNGDYLEGKIEKPDRDVAEHMEETIDRVRDKLKKRSRKVLEKSDDVDIRGELAFIDIISYLEHVGDRCLSIAETVHRISR
jgi:phosphate:Na+ symporter